MTKDALRFHVPMLNTIAHAKDAKRTPNGIRLKPADTLHHTLNPNRK